MEQNNTHRLVTPSMGWVSFGSGDDSQFQTKPTKQRQWACRRISMRIQRISKDLVEIFPDLDRSEAERERGDKG